MVEYIDPKRQEFLNSWKKITARADYLESLTPELTQVCNVLNKVDGSKVIQNAEYSKLVNAGLCNKLRAFNSNEDFLNVYASVSTALFESAKYHGYVRAHPWCYKGEAYAIMIRQERLRTSSLPYYAHTPCCCVIL